MKKVRIQKIVAVFTVGIIGGSVFSACKNNADGDILNDIVSREDYRSVYGAIGKSVTLSAVREDETGRAYATVDGVEYELGMDFLSMALVYNTTPTGAFPTRESAYNEWWRLYIQRWNFPL